MLIKFRNLGIPVAINKTQDTVLACVIFGENPKTYLSSHINGFFRVKETQNPKWIIFHDNANKKSNQELRAISKTKQNFAVNWFVLEKFFNKNATRKKYLSNR